MDNFEKDLLAELDRAIKQIEKGVTEAVSEGLQRAVEMSPVDTGYFANNHRIGLNTDDVDLVPSARPQPIGHPVLSTNSTEIVNRESGKLANFKIGDLVIIGNAVSYALHVDRIAAVYERTSDAIFFRIEKKFK